MLTVSTTTPFFWFVLGWHIFFSFFYLLSYPYGFISNEFLVDSTYLGLFLICSHNLCFLIGFFFRPLKFVIIIDMLELGLIVLLFSICSLCFPFLFLFPYFLLYYIILIYLQWLWLYLFVIFSIFSSNNKIHILLHTVNFELISYHLKLYGEILPPYRPFSLLYYIYLPPYRSFSLLYYICIHWKLHCTLS